TQALRRFATERGLDAPVLVPAGGVAANGAVRAALARAAEAAGGRLVLPPFKLCTDNGAMIAWAGAERLFSGVYEGMEAPARPRWPLDATAAPKLGAGRLGAKA
ncbi:hypothetical protein J8J40_23980, partial [Mycobacterium tuberculosis]|nr:hypothetical protein [Mycobacterium tuberculosis]